MAAQKIDVSGDNTRPPLWCRPRAFIGLMSATKRSPRKRSHVLGHIDGLPPHLAELRKRRGAFSKNRDAPGGGGGKTGCGASISARRGNTECDALLEDGGRD